MLHEYYKETAGDGSKWGAFIRSLKVRFLTTEALQSLTGTTAGELSADWMSVADKFSQWCTGHDGPCNPTTYICRTKPKDRIGDNRFTLHQIRWAYWVVKQNAVRVVQEHTGNSYLALIPFYNMLEKKLCKLIDGFHYIFGCDDILLALMVINNYSIWWWSIVGKRQLCSG